MEEEGVAEKKPPIAEEGGVDEMVVANKEEVAVATLQADAVVVEF